MMAAAAALSAAGLPTGPAAAERVQAQLSVRATVLPACIVTTASDGAAHARFTCTHGERPIVAAGTSTAPPPPFAVAADPAGSGRTKMVTLTY